MSGGTLSLYIIFYFILTIALYYRPGSSPSSYLAEPEYEPTQLTMTSSV